MCSVVVCCLCCSGMIYHKFAVECICLDLLLFLVCVFVLLVRPLLFFGVVLTFSGVCSLFVVVSCCSLMVVR